MGASTQVEVAFSPISEGAVSGILHVLTATGAELEIGLRGEGFRIPMIHEPDDYDFGDVSVGSTASTVCLATLSSPWEAWVGIGEIVSVSLAGSPDYSIPIVYKNSVVVPVTFPVELGPMDTLYIQINYQPGSTGTSAAILNIACSDGMIYDSNLTGTGIAGGPEIYVNPNSLIVEMYAGMEASSSFVIGNSGDSALHYILDTSTLPSWIVLIPTEGFVAVGDSAVIEVFCDGTSVIAGNYSSVIEITSNDPAHASMNLMITVVVTNAALLADFHANPLMGHPPLAVQFHDDSISDATATWSSINSWDWDFDNDGVFDSSQQHPLHTYTQPGVYSVRLVVGTNTGLTSTKLRTDYINIGNSAPVIAVPYPSIPDMEEDTPWGPTNLSYVFSDPDGDPLVLTAKGSVHLTATVSPDGLYIVPEANWFGTETITLTAADPYGLAVAQSIVVSVASVNDAPEVNIPADLYFIRNSTFNVDFAQYIDDPDNPDSEISIQLVAVSAPPVVFHVYTPVNTPNVVGQLTVSFSSPSQAEANQVFQIQVNDNQGRLISFANFNVHVLEHFTPQITLDDTYQYTGQNVGFNDATLGNPDHWLWNFGDGNTSTEQNPIHQYLSSGTYDVSLTLGNSQVPDEDRMILMPGLIHLSGTAVTIDFIPANWTIQGSPYNLFEDVIIQPDDIVVIEPNVEVNCFGEEPVDIQGSLQANGVIFRPPAGGGLWGGLRFRGSGLREPSSLQNCQLVDAQNPLIIEDNSPQISNLSITVSDTTAVLDGTAIRLQGQSACQITGAELLNYKNGIVIETEGSDRDTPVLTNVRIRNSSSAIREVNDPSVAIKLVSNASLNDVEISNYDKGLVIETTDDRTSTTPSLTNVRIRNSSSSIRNMNTGLYLGAQVKGTLTNSRISNASLGIFIAQGNRTVLENNVVANCLTGIKAYGENPLPLRKTILYVDTAFLNEHPGMVQAAYDLNGTGSWNLYQNTVFRYPIGIKASFAEVHAHTNIFWTDNSNLQPVAQNNSTVMMDYSDIWSLGGGYVGMGNINADPLFTDVLAGDFQLLRSSPCIDAGGPSANPDPDGSIADQGAIPYLHRASATVAPRFVVVGTNVSFHNTSLGHDYPDTQISWDIGNDGSVESVSRDFGFTFNTPGVYSLGLTMQSGSLVDYVVYPAFIVVSSQALLAPQNPVLTVDGADITFQWDPVNFSVEGLPVEVQFYIVYKADRPDGFYAFSSFIASPQTSWTDYGAALNERAFYLVLGFAGSRADLLEYIAEHPQLSR